MSERHIKDIAVSVLQIEAQSITGLVKQINSDFVSACEIMMQCTGRIVVTGMGKSGHIGGKIAATLASTGTPAFFMHPGDASHGDLGMITTHDVVLAISNSGCTDEIVNILPIIKHLGVPLVAMTGNAASVLATRARVHLDTSVAEEACPLGLAPTASTTAALAMGDALAVAIFDSRGFTEEDFARSHPSGQLGRRLLLRVADIMQTGDDLPSVSANASLSQAVVEITRAGIGMTAIVDDSNRVLGIFTDGDLRRHLDEQTDFHKTPIANIMTRDCITVGPELLAAKSLQIMQDKSINALIVVDEEHRIIGAFNMHTLLRAGLA